MKAILALSLVFFACQLQAHIILDGPISVENGWVSLRFHSTSTGYPMFSDDSGTMLLLPDSTSNDAAGVTPVPAGSVIAVGITLDHLYKALSVSGPDNVFHVGVSTNGTTLGGTIGDDFLNLKIAIEPAF